MHRSPLAARTLLAVAIVSSLAPTSSHAFLSRVISKFGSKAATSAAGSRIASRTLSRTATPASGGVVSRLLSRGRSLLSRRNSAFEGATLGAKGKGSQSIRKAANARLRDGESITGVHSAWYRTRDGNLFRAAPNEFQRNLSEIAEGAGHQIVGVTRATFVTSHGRRVTVGSLPIWKRLNGNLKMAGITVPAIIGANVISQFVGTAFRAGERTIQQVGEPKPDPTEEPLGQGGSTAPVIQIDPSDLQSSGSSGTSTAVIVITQEPGAEPTSGAEDDGEEPTGGTTRPSGSTRVEVSVTPPDEER